VCLAAAVVHSLIQPLPSGTAFCIGVVLLIMMTGRLVQTKGSLARAVLPFVVHLRWGWHRVERARERGTCSLDAMFDRAADWCLAHLPLEPVRLGRAHRADRKKKALFSDSPRRRLLAPCSPQPPPHAQHAELGGRLAQPIQAARRRGRRVVGDGQPAPEGGPKRGD
jgi:hypothetical protein